MKKNSIIKRGTIMMTAFSLISSASAETLCLENIISNQMCSLGTLKIDNSDNSYATAVSANGSTVVGSANTDSGDTHAFVWRAEVGMTDLGTLKFDNSGYSNAVAVSADGNTVVGSAQNNANLSHAFAWRAETGMVDLGTLKSDNSGYSNAIAVSADGNTVVGNAQNNANLSHAFAWRTETGMVDLGTLKSDNTGSSTATAISANGETVVGHADTDLGSYHAYVWQLNTGMQDLGTLRADNTGYSDAVAISANGETVVGQADTDLGSYHAYAWRLNTGMQDLGTLKSDNSGYSTAYAVSADGNTIVGEALNNNDNTHAFTWRADTGMLDLGTLKADNSGDSAAFAVSANGNTVVGSANNDSDETRAFLWRSATGMLDLGTLKADNSGNSTARAVSADGTTVVGDSDTDAMGIQRAFIWRTTSDNNDNNNNNGDNDNTDNDNGNNDNNNNKSDDNKGITNIGVMQDYHNLMDSYDRLSNETEIAIRSQQRALSNALDQSCFADKAGGSCIKVSGIITASPSNREQDNSRVGRSTLPFGALSYGYGITDHITLGGMVSVFGVNQRNSDVNMGNGLGLGLFSRYSQGGNTHTGWQAGINLAYGVQSMDIMRGYSFSNVQYGRGKKNLNTFAIRLNAGYGFALANDWLLTPNMNISHYRSSRGAYQEERKGMAFETQYNQLRDNSTIASVGLKVEKAIGERSRIQFDLGVEGDLKVEDVALSGQTNVFTLGDSTKHFSISSSLPRNKVRPYGQLSYNYGLSNNKGTIGTSLRASLPEYGKRSAEYGLGLSYSLNF